MAACLGTAVFLVSSILGIVAGTVALRQIKRTSQEGRGLALAGIWIAILYPSVAAALLVAYLTVPTT